MSDKVRDAIVRSGLMSSDRVDRFVRSGHFVYESGDHGDVWLDLDLLFFEPVRLRKPVEALAMKIRRYKPEVVVAPLIGGALVGQLMAQVLDIAFVYAERVGRIGSFRYALPPAARGLVSGKRVTIVDDVINAGSATLATLDEVRSCLGIPVAASALMIRAAARADVSAKAGVPVENLIDLDWNIWKPDLCPMFHA